ncbi:hypothetical protein KR074_008251, partial [Drosophila pseudoananassae]
MKRRCVDDMDITRKDRSPCCEAQFPFDPHIFELCLPIGISNMYDTWFFRPGLAGPKFADPHRTESEDYRGLEGNESVELTASITPLVAKAIIIEFESNVAYSTIYANIKEFYEAVETWFQQQLMSAPPELRGGWFTSDLKFYNVQDTLSQDTLVAICLAMAASLAVLLSFTVNILISFYAVLTVSLSIFNTVAVLI